MDNRTDLTNMLAIKHPIIMAPMFLVTTPKMVIAALESGITAAIPALNYRTTEELQDVIKHIKSETDKPFGVNLIVNRSNIKYKEQLKVCLDNKVDFIITSLGNPKEAIEKCKKEGIKVFCDVTDLKFAKKVEALGADAIIAVNSLAGGHAGNIKPKDLITQLIQNVKVPVISAGGVATNQQYREMFGYGAAGISMGTVFIASEESGVNDEYKSAILKYKGSDIVSTEKLSGSKLTVINTPYVQSVGTKANILEKILNRNKRLRKYFKMLLVIKSMKRLEKAAFSTTYKTVWCAGPSIEHIDSIKPIQQIVDEITGN